MEQHASQDLTPVNDGRVRVENLDFMMTQPPRVFKFLRIDANDNCNLKCTYCRIPRSSQLVEADDLERFLNEKVISVESLQFGCGMEPTIDPRLADLMLMASKTPAKPSVRYILQTNGTKLHRHDYQKMNEAGLTRLSVSIDSMDEEVHAFQRGGSSVKQIINNLELFRQHCPQVDVQVICVVTRASIAGCEAVAQFAIDLGVSRIAFREMMHVPDDPVADPVKVGPLIVPPGEFAAMTERIQAKYLDRGTEFVFWPIDRLHQNRFNMRKKAFPVEKQGHWQRRRLMLNTVNDQQTSPDKPVLLPVTEKQQDLLEGKKFFLLRGFPKSGTTWIGRILNLHPQVSCAGEFNWMNLDNPFTRNLESSYLMREKPGLRDAMLARVERMKKECMVLANHPAAIWVGDRTPSALSEFEVRDAKAIHLIRDGRDVLVSHAHRFYMRSQSAETDPGVRRRMEAFEKDPNYFLSHVHELLDCPAFVRATARAWSESVITSQTNLAQLCASERLEIRYESFHENADDERERLYAFFELDPSLAAPLVGTTVAGLANESPRSFLRKGIVGDWRNYMTDEAAQIFNEEAGDTLIQLGYAENNYWL